MLHRLVTFLVLTLGLSGPGCAQSDRGSLSWQSVRSLIARDFPGVPSITTDSLARRLALPAPPLLLDAREPAEFAVSHLPGARRVGPDVGAEALRQTLAGVPRGQPIVVYCSVGYRSAGVAQKLRGAGFTDVVNLEGSIFQWANEGRPLVRGDSLVREVHPYSRAWGRLLRPERRAQAETE